jgi:hypothetical protein
MPAKRKSATERNEAKRIKNKRGAPTEGAEKEQRVGERKRER